MLFLHAQLFFLFGTLVAALPTPNLPSIKLPYNRLLYYDIPNNAVGFWRRDHEETKKFSSNVPDIFYVTLDEKLDIQFWALQPKNEPSDLHMKLECNILGSEQLLDLGKKWHPLPKDLVPHGYPEHAFVDPKLVAYIQLDGTRVLWGPRTLTIKVKSE